ncbi:MAG: ATP-dependent zinc metalloprotease FtsH [Lachnospiraceae bacterium]|nr:ATP-dependent zinc metalloprotease FtsH [Lachnospiraceae bacterium]
MNENKNDNNKHDPEHDRKIRRAIIIAACIFGFIFLVSRMNSVYESMTTKELEYNEFIYYLDNGVVKNVEIHSSRARLTVYMKDGQTMADPKKTYYVSMTEDSTELTKRLESKNVAFKSITSETSSVLLSIFLNYILPLGLILALFIFMTKSVKGGMGLSIGKSNAKMYVQNKTGVTFKDVAGQEEAKESLTEIVDFLHNPEKYVRIGAKLPKGALLVGPPGTGKTLLAKAVAGEANVPFFSLSGSEFVEMYVGVGASRVRDLFKSAQAQAPCIIFIDEIDAIGKSRERNYGNDEREQTLNQLLAEMDGFDSSKGLVILAATNRPETLDKALLRPGRFDRQIIVDKPDLNGRTAILKVHAKHVLMHENVNLEEIALATPGAVGADLANMINEAAILAVKRGRSVVKQEDLLESVEVVLAGKEKKGKILNEEEKKIVATHEIGHALIAAVSRNKEPIQKITIVPRTMGSLGYVLHTNEEERHLKTKEEMERELVEFCGGRAAEEISFGKITTGASNDIEQATNIARAMITCYGMDPEFGMVKLEEANTRYLDDRRVMICSDITAARIDTAVSELMKKSYKEAVAILTEHKAELEELANYLFEKETITGSEFMRIYEEIKNRNKVVLKKEAVSDSVASENEVAEASENETGVTEVEIAKTEITEPVITEAVTTEAVVVINNEEENQETK